MGIGEDLARSLAAGAATTPEEMEERGWPIEEQVDAVLEHLRVHRAGGSVQLATDRELYILEELIDAGVLDEGARDYFRRMDPAEQPEREEWLFGKREQHAKMREAHKAWDEWAEASEAGRYPIPDHIVDLLGEAGY